MKEKLLNNIFHLLLGTVDEQQFSVGLNDVIR